MENRNTEDEGFEKFTWTIRNFSSLDSKKLYSEKFSLDGHTWRILVFPKGNKVNSLSIYLDAGDVNMPSEWEKFANFKFTLIDQLNHTMNEINETSHTFNAREDDWGFASFIPLSKLLDSKNGFIVNDTCIIEVHMLVQKSKHEKQVDKSVSNIDSKCIERIDNISPKEMISTSFGELVDFRGIGKVEKDFVPLLEEVCTRYPSLVDSKQKKSQRFIEWAFTALGRVLHFLKTKKVRDMDSDACNHLQNLWEELETCGFDLAWLKPHVQSALGMKACVERALEVKRLEENVTTMEENATTLEMEIKALQTKMIEAGVNLEITRRDLVKAKEGFEECDLDAELGY